MKRRRFITFQPSKALLALKEEGMYRNTFDYPQDHPLNSFISSFISEKGYTPIFCIPFTNLSDIICDSFLISPSLPESVIIFDAYDYTTCSINYMHSFIRNRPCEEDPYFPIRVFMIPEINYLNVLHLQDIPQFENSCRSYLKFLANPAFHQIICRFTHESYSMQFFDRLPLAL